LINFLLRPEIQQFIRDHEHHDPFSLALKLKIFSSEEARIIVQQVHSRQKARLKMPEWYQKEGIVFPPPLSLEQASSEITARYKATVFGKGNLLLDLTGGTGIDSYFLNGSFSKCVFVEQDSHLVKLAEHNFSLTEKKFGMNLGKAEDFLLHFNGVADVIYLDPSRRTGRKVIRLSDSEPDPVKLRNQLLQKSKSCWIKASPLQDIQAAVNQLEKVAQVQVVAVGSECKELLLELNSGGGINPLISAVNIDAKTNKIQKFSFNLKEEEGAAAIFSLPKLFIYEPNAAILKSGAFKILSQRKGLFKIGVNSHLYTSDELQKDFPGRIFKNLQTVTNFKNLNLKQANIISRNYPLSVSDIRKKTSIGEGGDSYLIATSDLYRKKIVIVAERLK
jgi:hypothetical protein